MINIRGTFIVPKGDIVKYRKAESSFKRKIYALSRFTTKFNSMEFFANTISYIKESLLFSHLFALIVLL